MIMLTSSALDVCFIMKAIKVLKVWDMWPDTVIVGTPNAGNVTWLWTPYVAATNQMIHFFGKFCLELWKTLVLWAI